MLKMHVFYKFFSHCLVDFLGKTLQKRSKIKTKNTKTLQNPAFLCLLGRCTDFPDCLTTGSRLVCDWFPISKKWCWNLPKAVSGFGPKFAELDDFLGFGRCFGGFGAGGASLGIISGDFYRYLTFFLVSIGIVFYFSKSGNAVPCW